MAGKQVGTRLDEQEVKGLKDLSQTFDRTESDTLGRLVPTGPWPKVFALFARRKRLSSPFDASANIMADGLRREMESSDKSPGRAVTANMGPDEVAEFYLQWSDGMSTLLGLAGILDNRYTLVQLKTKGREWQPERNPAFREGAAVPRDAVEVINALRSGHLLTQMWAFEAIAKNGRWGIYELPEVRGLFSRVLAGDVLAIDELERIILAAERKDG